VCEQFAQGRYLAVQWARVEPATPRSLVRPLHYQATQRVAVKNDTNLLQSLKIKCFRKILKIQWQQTIENKKMIKSTSTCINIMQKMMENKLNLFGHICRERESIESIKYNNKIYLKMQSITTVKQLVVHITQKRLQSGSCLLLWRRHKNRRTKEKMQHRHLIVREDN